MFVPTFLDFFIGYCRLPKCYVCTTNCTGVRTSPPNHVINYQSAVFMKISTLEIRMLSEVSVAVRDVIISCVGKCYFDATVAFLLKSTPVSLHIYFS